MRRACALLLAAMLSACAHLESEGLREDSGTLPERSEVVGVPFYPQQEHYCGPASLAMVLSWSGEKVAQEKVAPQVFTPGRAGSFRTDIIAAARRHGRLAVPVRELQGVLAELGAGHPVLVFQNLGLDWWPRWHFAVAIGYDLSRGTVILHTGRTPAREVALATFERTWDRGGSWALVVLPPGDLPAGKGPLDVLEAAVGFERTGKDKASERVYAAVTRRWPGQLGGWMGLGNSRYRRGDLEGAEKAFRGALRQHPRAAAAWNNLAVVLKERGRREAARDAALAAVRFGEEERDTYRRTLEEIGGLEGAP
ncbi:PA2778 family cysteine peptidase [Thiohalorhabdus methylotrophus]|uniref:PA2778 family cysteine peptidase n=1 Tax=Thiohalorhabdus methylotrophus TaxID=3242694 RepID=A0ABV4TW47_9GAMM